MHQVNIHEAKTRLSQLIQMAVKGEEIIIAKGNKPVVRLEVLPEARLQRKIGSATGLVKFMSDDFNEPLSDFKDYM